jgi:hypothetical protein
VGAAILGIGSSKVEGCGEPILDGKRAGKNTLGKGRTVFFGFEGRGRGGAGWFDPLFSLWFGFNSGERLLCITDKKIKYIYKIGKPLKCHRFLASYFKMPQLALFL